MRSRFTRPMRIFLLFCVGLASAAALASAASVMLDWRVLGSGSAGGTCATLLAPGCSANSGGTAVGTHVGNSTWDLSVTAGSFFGNTADGGSCFVASGTGDVTAANGDMVSFRTVGSLCNESTSTSPYLYKGAFRIYGGTGRFSAAVGAGDVAASNVQGGPSYVKIDGTINY